MMIKYYVYFIGHNGMNQCHCFENNRREANHFASLVNGKVILEINGHEINKITEHTHGTHIYMRLLIDNQEYEVDCYLRNDGELFKTTADGTDDREKVIAAFKELY